MSEGETQAELEARRKKREEAEHAQAEKKQKAEDDQKAKRESLEKDKLDRIKKFHDEQQFRKDFTRENRRVPTPGEVGQHFNPQPDEKLDDRLAGPKPATISNDQIANLLHEVAQLKRKVAELETRPMPRGQRIYPVALADSVSGQEQAIDGGEFVDLVDGAAPTALFTPDPADSIGWVWEDTDWSTTPPKRTGAIIATGGGGSSGELVPCNLSSASGSAGDASNPAAFTYTVKTTDNVTTLGTSQAPSMQRSAKGKMVAGTIGIWNVTDGVLWWADEVADRGCGTACS